MTLKRVWEGVELNGGCWQRLAKLVRTSDTQELLSRLMDPFSVLCHPKPIPTNNNQLLVRSRPKSYKQAT
jgi:hypothetical protein